MARIGRNADLVVRRAQRLRPRLRGIRRALPAAIGPKTSLLVLGDARNNCRSAAARHAPAGGGGPARLLAEPGAPHLLGAGNTATKTYEPLFDEMVECRNVEQLAEFVQRLLPT